MAKHRPSSIWPLRWPLGVKDEKGRVRANGNVQTIDKWRIGLLIHHPDLFGEVAKTDTIILDRTSARLLAKRINQCLDSTISRARERE